MFEDRFGYDPKLPENIRFIYMWLCDEVAKLQTKWDFYLELYGKEENTELLNDLALWWSFNIIEETLRYDITMSIGRLSDPLTTMGKENLSFATLVEKISDIPDIKKQFENFKVACKTVSEVRNKQVAHNDYNTKISPMENRLPGITKTEIDQILKLATDILTAVSNHYDLGQLMFNHTIGRGGVEELIFWLKAGKENRWKGNQT